MSMGANGHVPQVSRGVGSERRPPDPNKWTAIGLVALFTLTLPAILGVMVAVDPREGADGAVAHVAASGDVETGASIYARTCTLCHGPTGAGVLHLGKPLRNSAFVQGHSDDELMALLTHGRSPDDPANTTGVPMPPRGAQGLGDDELREVIAFVRTMQDPSQPTASVDPWVIKPAGSAPAGPEASTLVEVADRRPMLSPEALAGHDVFIASCSACHGQDAMGMEGLGKPLVGSAFVQSKSNAELVTFVKAGRPVWDAANTTGVDMPPKGGNPALSDEDLSKIIAYIRSLQRQGSDG